MWPHVCVSLGHGLRRAHERVMQTAEARMRPRVATSRIGNSRQLQATYALTAHAESTQKRRDDSRPHTRPLRKTVDAHEVAARHADETGFLKSTSARCAAGSPLYPARAHAKKGHFTGGRHGLIAPGLIAMQISEND